MADGPFSDFSVYLYRVKEVYQNLIKRIYKKIILFKISRKLLGNGDFVSSIYLFIIKTNHKID